MPVDERTFAAEAASWINAILHDHPDLPYEVASVEEHTPGVHTRRDITLWRDRNRTQIALTGEVKVPGNIHGQTPYDYELVQDAFNKANAVGNDYFFTWNVNTFVLWRTWITGVPLTGRSIEEMQVVNIRESSELDSPNVKDDIRLFLETFLERFARIERGEETLGERPLDESFIRALESSLVGPIYGTIDAITAHYATDAEFRSNIDQWMRDAQGWTLSDDMVAQRENFERAARLSCYVLVNRLVFAEALRRRFPLLTPVDPSSLGDNGVSLRTGITQHFSHAMAVSHDYESVFNEDFGDTLPFQSDEAVPEWLQLIRQIADYDFTALNYDVIGRIFERLIEPEERHKYGQHYTQPAVVDLINAFCIRTSDAVTLDPACGGGTFLVRAYARKRNLAQRDGQPRSHQLLLSDLYGSDISAFAAHLSTINLATRDLIDDANYPRIAHRDFFQIEPGVAAFTIPGLGAKQQQQLSLQAATLDALVGNPPYIKQENIGATQKNALRALLGRDYRDIEIQDRPRPSGRSDLHVYFWLHGARFLREGGYLGLLTSSTWLDVDYGFPLQHFILKNFRVVAVLESRVEPWFTDARVITAATILQKESNPNTRAQNLIRFVSFHRPLASFIPETGNEATRQAAVERFVAEIEAVTTSQQTTEWRTRVVPQRDIAQGIISLNTMQMGGQITTPIQYRCISLRMTMKRTNPSHRCLTDILAANGESIFARRMSILTSLNVPVHATYLWNRSATSSTGSRAGTTISSTSAILQMKKSHALARNASQRRGASHLQIPMLCA